MRRVSIRRRRPRRSTEAGSAARRMRLWRRGCRGSDAMAAVRLRCRRRLLRHRCLHVRRQQRQTAAAPVRNSSGAGGGERNRSMACDEQRGATEGRWMPLRSDASDTSAARTTTLATRTNSRATIPAPPLPRPSAFLRRPFRSRRGRLDRKKIFWRFSKHRTANNTIIFSADMLKLNINTKDAVLFFMIFVHVGVSDDDLKFFRECF